MKNKKLLGLLALAVILGGVVAFGVFSSEDSQGRVRNRSIQSRSTTTTPSANNNTQAVSSVPAQAPGAATITDESYSEWNIGSGNMLNAPISSNTGGGGAINLWGAPGCDESNYQPMGIWKMVVENRPLHLTQMAFQMSESIGVAFKVKVGTSKNSDNIASQTTYKSLSGTDLTFNNVSATLAPGTYYITLYGKYRADAPATWHSNPGWGGASYETMITSMMFKTNSTWGEFVSYNGLMDVPAIFKTNATSPVSNIWAQPNDGFVVGFQKDVDQNYTCQR